MSSNLAIIIKIHFTLIQAKSAISIYKVKRLVSTYRIIRSKILSVHPYRPTMSREAIQISKNKEIVHNLA